MAQLPVTLRVWGRGGGDGGSKADATAAAGCADGAASDCQRCPRLDSETHYTAFVVGAAGVPNIAYATTGVAALRVFTADVHPPNWRIAPAVAAVAPEAVTVTFALSEPGTVHYVIAFASAGSSFFSQYVLTFATTLPLTAASLDASATLLSDGVVARGAARVASAQATRLSIDAPCVLAACDVPQNVNQTLLSPATDYRVALLAEDASGNVQGAPHAPAGLPDPTRAQQPTALPRLHRTMEWTPSLAATGRRSARMLCTLLSSNDLSFFLTSPALSWTSRTGGAERAALQTQRSS